MMTCGAANSGFDAAPEFLRHHVAADLGRKLKARIEGEWIDTEHNKREFTAAIKDALVRKSTFATSCDRFSARGHARI